MWGGHVGASVLAVFVTLACSSGSESGGVASGTCEAAFRARCQRACECQPGPECAWAPGSFTTDGGIVVVGGTVAKTDAICDQAVAIECHNGGDPEGNYPVCETKSKTAACVDFDGNGVTYTGVEPIPECRFN